MSIVELERAGDPLEQIPTLPVEPETRSDILRKAADLIRANGWTKGSDGMRVHGPHCILGAVAEAMRAPAQPVEVTSSGEELWEYDMDPPARLIGSCCEEIYTWNDNLDDPSLIKWMSNMAARQRVVRSLKRLADGATWEEATR